eukprot:1460622-Prymnesium_polylepis.2
MTELNCTCTCGAARGRIPCARIYAEIFEPLGPRLMRCVGLRVREVQISRQATHRAKNIQNVRQACGGAARRGFD